MFRVLISFPTEQKFLQSRFGTLLTQDENSRADLIVGGAGDMQGKYGKYVYTKDSDRTAYVEEYLPLWFGYFEKLLVGEYFVTEEHAIHADILMFNIMWVVFAYTNTCFK